MSRISTVQALIRAHEGDSAKLYYLNGIPHIGVGHNLASGPDLSPHARDVILGDDLATMIEACQRLEGWTRCSEVRQAVLIDMAFNLGVSGLRGFGKMLQAVALQDWPTAATEIRHSHAHDTPGLTERYDELARMMESDQWP